MAVWQVGKDINKNNTTVSPLDGRYPFTKRISYNDQCVHELVSDKKLGINKYDHKTFRVSHKNNPKQHYNINKKLNFVCICMNSRYEN